MNKICTSLEQSKKLIELGIDINTADMMWDDWRLIDDEWKIFIGYDQEIEQDYGRKCYPAWSLTALLIVLPQGTRLLKSATDEMYHCDCPKGNIDKWFDNPIDACYEVVCLLKENNKI